MTEAAIPVRAGLGLLRWSAFAALLAAAGLPIYIHAPKAYVEAYGLSLASLGTALAVLRLIDVVQDPLLGWVAEKLKGRVAPWAFGTTLVMGGAMVLLFVVPAPIAPLWWFALTLALLFTAYSFLGILFYAEGVAKAGDMGPGGHLRLAGWREAGSLTGVCLATVAPVVLMALGLPGMASFALGFALFALVAAWLMAPQWSRRGRPAADQSNAQAYAGLSAFRPALTDPVARRLLLLSLVNSAPVAITSTLFLFFVESRLDAPGWEGPLLLLFFLSAALSTPLWTRLAAARGPRLALLAGMVLSVLAFLWALTLGPGEIAAFAVISAASGATLGADMVLLPALFARRLANLGQGGESAGFGLWNFASKLSLALAAATVLPALDRAGFISGGDNTAAALSTLTLLYAGLPCALKLGAIALLLTTPLGD